MELSSAKLTTDNIYIKLQEKVPSIGVNTEKIGFNFTFNYLIDTKPDIIQDKGIGYAYFNSLKMKF